MAFWLGCRHTSGMGMTSWRSLLAGKLGGRRGAAGKALIITAALVAVVDSACSLANGGGQACESSQCRVEKGRFLRFGRQIARFRSTTGASSTSSTSSTVSHRLSSRLASCTAILWLGILRPGFLRAADVMTYSVTSPVLYKVEFSRWAHTTPGGARE